MVDTPPQESTVVNCDTQGLMGWTKEEKFYLLLGLKSHNSSEVENIQAFIPTKTSEEIKTAVNFYKKKAILHPIFRENKKKKAIKRLRETQAPLSSWAKLLTDKYSFNQLCTETSTAVRLIACLENIPDAPRTENIDFRKIYRQLANAMEGKPIVADNFTTAVLHKCLIETALASKAFIKTATFKYILNSINFSEEIPNINFLQDTDDKEVTTLRHLIINKAYNPLGIDEAYLSHLNDKIN